MCGDAGDLIGGIGSIVVCCLALPILCINIASIVVLALFYNGTNLAIWLATNTAYSLAVCVGVIIATCYVWIKDVKDVRELMIGIWCVPVFTFAVKIIFNIWGAIQLFTVYPYLWDHIATMSVIVLAIQWLVYLAIGILFCLFVSKDIRLY
jgi:hypothetical protein